MRRKSVKKVSIIIPAFNEERYIHSLLRKISRLKIPDIEKEIIIVDDGSTDKTSKIIEDFSAQNKNVLVFSQKNLGKGAAVRKAFSLASGDVFIIQDADLEYPPENIISLLKPIVMNNADVVYGSRKLNKENKYSSLVYFIGGAFINVLIGKVLKHNATDFISGSKAFRSHVLKKIGRLESKGFEIDTELSAKVIKTGFKIIEVPIVYNPRTHKEGKKIRWYHSIKIIWILLKSI